MLKNEIEQRTDKLALAPLELLGAEAVRRIIELTTPLAQAIHAAGAIPSPNPIGLPAATGPDAA